MAEVAGPGADLCPHGTNSLTCRRADLISAGAVHVKAKTTVNSPQTSSKTASTGTRQASLQEREARVRLRLENQLLGSIIMPSAAGNGEYLCTRCFINPGVREVSSRQPITSQMGNGCWLCTDDLLTSNRSVTRSRKK